MPEALCQTGDIDISESVVDVIILVGIMNSAIRKDSVKVVLKESS